MVIMGSLQPGLPFPAAIQKDYHILVIDIKDCFFTIPLHKQDQKRFAFSVPSPKMQKPFSRYEWKVLPQGMANSPTMCQMYVNAALLPLRRSFSGVTIIHYMDDILLASPSRQLLFRCYKQLNLQLGEKGLAIAPEKAIAP